MPHQQEMQWPLSARGERPRIDVLTSPHEKPNNSVNLPPYPDDNDDARALIASKLWGGSRRYSDSSSKLSDRALFHQSLGRHDLANRTGLSFFVADEPLLSPQAREVDLGGSITHLLSPPLQSPTRPSSAALRYTPVSVQRGYSQRPFNATEPQLSTKDGFLSWTEFTPHPLPVRLSSSSLKSQRDEVITAVSSLSVSGVPIMNVGKLARPVMNKYYKTEQALSSFTATTERTLLLPSSSPPNPSIRYLERLESDLLNTSKYLSSSSSSNSHNLTVLTWSDDSPWGTATLFEVTLPESASASLPPPPGIGLLARRRRNTTLSVTTKTPSANPPNQAISIRPVAAMELVPRQLLIQFRLESSIRKMVLSHTENKFKWTSTAGSKYPSYATLADPEDDDEEEDLAPEQPRTAQPSATRSLYSALDSDIDAVLGPRSSSSSSFRRARQRTYLSPSDPRIKGEKEVEVDADGVLATIPQFLALLHTQHSILEIIDSTPITTQKLKTKAGYEVRGVSLREWPKGKNHSGRDVSVVVLMPSESGEGNNNNKWMNERIFWSDDRSGLQELRGRRYRGVIRREKRRRGETREREWIEERSPGLWGSARSAAW
ncbi:hypothetical protein QBC43DRAFT_338772 [Cladorrhinum sp. PSN259]|nr:hypothetical protein QBC43DRAFT_338772 [Cladorrhinum sp. PSN259]